jgi:hypothetical protein
MERSAVCADSMGRISYREERCAHKVDSSNNKCNLAEACRSCHRIKFHTAISEQLEQEDICNALYWKMDHVASS